MFALGKSQHLLCQTAVGLSGSILRSVIENALPGGGTLRYLDGVFYGPLKNMKRLAVDLAHTFPDAAAQLRPGLVHGQQDAGNLEFWIKFLPTDLTNSSTSGIPSLARK